MNSGGHCIYDSYSPCEECGRCRSREDIIAEAEANGDIDEDTFAQDDDDNYWE